MFDLVIDNASFVVTCDSNNRVLRNSSIAVSKKKIVAIQESGTLHGKVHFDARGKLLAPGLINTHTHLAMTLLRGWSEGVNLQGFLERVWAAEKVVMNPENVFLGSKLGALESLLGGTTTTLDMYLFPEAAHRGAVESGLRHISGPIFFDFPGLDNLEWHQRIALARNWSEVLREVGGPYVPTYLMPHATYTVSPEHLSEIAMLAESLGASIHIHASENLKENQDVQARFSQSPTEVLKESNILDRHMVLGHGVQLSARDIEILVSSKSAVAHCPGSNLKLASGIADIKNYIDRGLTVSLGTDGCSSSNDLDMWSVMRLSGNLLANLNGAESLKSLQIFRLATIEGARSVGMSNLIGSIEIGKLADFICIDLAKPHLIPMHDVFAQLVFATGRADVSDVWVDGKQVIAEGRSSLINFSSLAREIDSAVSNLKELDER
jgi:5-methylthioadenosine/S-adenosylhomocysteine deaminase